MNIQIYDDELIIFVLTVYSSSVITYTPSYLIPTE